MDEVRQVKVDNWGIYFLQRLKHFFNRTDYCDLTLQFQDKAQLKVHRLVLSACTEYFELLERTCEMYEDCLVMPDDLQADVVVPIVNFMYTGHLEFKMDVLEKLYQTALVMNMPVLTKLLEAHRTYIKPKSYSKKTTLTPSASHNQVLKRPYSKAFDNVNRNKQQKSILISKDPTLSNSNEVKTISSTVPINQFGMSPYYKKRLIRGDPRPTRCELPEELENDDVYTNSFTNISYDSKPIVVHPETSKTMKKKSVFSKPSSSKNNSATILHCTKSNEPITSLFADTTPDNDADDFEVPKISNLTVPKKSAAQLFDQIAESNKSANFNKPKVTIETNDSKQAASLDHAKIISEVLKKYPHLVNSNKNIKLKVLNTNSKINSKHQSSTPSRATQKTLSHLLASSGEDKIDYIDREILDTKEAARLIDLGVENVEGPWLCLMCGTPSKALRFGSYYYYRRHLVEVHNEKPAARLCEYCGVKAPKRNVLLHHMLTKHGIDPPSQYHFPKCNQCDFIALTETTLARHKQQHESVGSFRCNVCTRKFSTSNQLLAHIQQSGHKFSAERKSELKCIYCLRVFIREGNLYSHIKLNHKNEAIRDGVIDDSDDEKNVVVKKEYPTMKFENSFTSDYEEETPLTESNTHQFLPQKLLKKNPLRKILNPGYPNQQNYHAKASPHSEKVQLINKQTEMLQEEYPSSIEDEELVTIDGEEYMVQNNQLINVSIPKRRKTNEEYIVSDLGSQEDYEIQQYDNGQHYINTMQMPNLAKKVPNSESMQYVVSNDEEYDTLMSSNHAIFDESSNKTLTVLTTPDTVSLSTTSSRSIVPDHVPNTMMIVPDDYPLSMSTSVDPDNPNIVVVYSQPEVDSNKAYQIITTENGDQFMQSTAVTHNYETITTSTAVPVTNDKNSHEPKQQQLVEMVDLGIENEVATTAEEEMAADTDTIETLPEAILPEQQLSQNIDDVEMSQTFTQHEAEVNESLEDNNVTQQDHALDQNLVAVEVGSVTQATVEVEVSDEVQLEKETIEENSLNESGDPTVAQEVDISSETPAVQSNLDQHQEDMHDTEIIQESRDTHEISETTNSEMHTVSIQKVPEIIQNKIVNITSEWSEDEAETVDESERIEQDTNMECSDRETSAAVLQQNAELENTTEPEDELEESIENIKKVMEKHDMDGPDQNEATANVNPNINDKESENTQALESQPQEKISSLLNDWEEDSQEEGNDENENTAPSVASDDVHNAAPTVAKDDQIKSLVSDWDDDEEEQKE